MGMSVFQKKLTHRNIDLKEQQHSCSEAVIVPSRKKTQHTKLFPINLHEKKWKMYMTRYKIGQFRAPRNLMKSSKVNEVNDVCLTFL